MPRNSRRNRRRSNKRAQTIAVSVKRRATASGPSMMAPFLSIARMFTASLPLPDDNNGTAIKALFDIGFSWLISTFASKNYTTGSYAIVGVSPAALVFNSPLIAKSTSGYSFPGYPVSIRNVHFNIVNTSALGQRSGRWAAVFIPYLEMHDASHYSSQLSHMTFQDVSAMPYSKVAPASKVLSLNYVMRDKTAYCARPRELKEEIGLIMIIWDTGYDKSDEKPSNDDFNCEIRFHGSYKPHVIFGPKFRVDHSSSTFNLRAINMASQARVTNELGEHQFLELSELDSATNSFEIMNLEGSAESP